ncbi:MAG: hypothetical protein V3S51_06235 [Dehalococcoidia bacterium]
MIEEQDVEKDSGDEEVQPLYFIDLNWYREQERSFVTLAESRLCPSTHTKTTRKSEAALLNTMRQCCSKREGFIAPTMPFLEMVFRTFLANGNQPLDLEQLQAKLEECLRDSISPRDLSVTKLRRIIDNDSYYGLRTAPRSDME